ncbi:nuclear valosin-containing protein-like [Culicoides brevitarsis]|uniref:nuclear valosin-containing protein-like n=1 Tax=Culicoides brevitarsis TaxID=469753 RepID=UPI00307BE7B2
MKKAKPILHDPHIIPRVQQYLEENVDKTYVDVGAMAKELQARWPEYGRRKAIPFRQLVEQAYKMVLHSYGLDSNPSSENDDDDDLEVMDPHEKEPRNNQMSDMMTNLYGGNKPRPQISNENDPIDISSDDDEEFDEPSQAPEASQQAQRSESNTPIDHRAHQATMIPNGNSVTITLKKFSRETEVEQPTPSSSQAPQFTKKRRFDEITPASGLTPSNSKDSSGSKPKKYKKEVAPKKSSVTFADIGGMDKTLKQLCELLMHIKHPEIYQHIGLPPPRGFLLHGPPGSGKTLLAHSIAGQLNIPLIEVPATELIAGVSGESEERIRDIFEQAAALTPCVLFIDEIDAISSNRVNAQKDMERRIVAQLLNSLDNLNQKPGGSQVLVIGATNRADSLDPALRRVGRFDQEISLGIPDRDARRQILQILCRKLKLEEPFDFDRLAALSPGYVGADLLALATRAASTAVKRIFKDKEQELFGEKLSKSDMEVDQLLDSITSKVNGDDSVVQIIDDNEPEVASTVEEKKIEDINVAEIVSEIAENIVESTKTDEKMDTDEVVASTEETKMDTAVVQEAQESVVDSSEAVNEPIVTENVPEKIEKPAEETKNEEKQTKKVEKLKLRELTLEDLLSWLNNSTPPLTQTQLLAFHITMQDFVDALKLVQPSAKREGFITVPDVTWDDIGSLSDIREQLKLAILAPVKYPERLKVLGLNAPSGVMLCGPPGCGKTLLAKAVANEAGINFISVKGPELLNMYVGESERAVRQCFQRARNSAPCVIFFDEFDSLCPKRSDSSENSAGMRVVNQLLTEMDGVEGRNGVFLMAATNRPDIVDPAVLRPGRFDKILYVGLPNEQDRVDILLALTKYGSKPPLAEDVDLKEVAAHSEGFTGADLAGLVRQAALYTLKSSIMDFDDGKTEQTKDLKVKKSDIFDALKSVRPSVSDEDKKHYEKLRRKYGQGGTDL